MKLSNIIINVILFLAVVALFVLFFTKVEKSPDNEVQKSTVGSNTAEIRIAYVQIDTILNNMKMYDDLTERFQNKQQEIETKMSSQVKAFEKEVADYQNKLQKGLVTRSEAQTLEQQLANRNAELEAQRNEFLMELQEENNVSQNKIIDYIMTFLEEYNNDRFDYILSYSFGGGILFAADRLDITYEVIEGLNNKYDKDNK